MKENEFPKENSYCHLFYIYLEDWKELWGKVVGVRTLLRQILTSVSMQPSPEV